MGTEKVRSRQRQGSTPTSVPQIPRNPQNLPSIYSSNFFTAITAPWLSARLCFSSSVCICEAHFEFLDFIGVYRSEFEAQGGEPCVTVSRCLWQQRVVQGRGRKMRTGEYRKGTEEAEMGLERRSDVGFASALRINLMTTAGGQIRTILRSILVLSLTTFARSDTTN